MSDDPLKKGDRPGRSLVLREEERQPGFAEFARAVPGVARIVVSAGWQAATRTADAYSQTASRMVRAAARGEPAPQVIQETAAELRAYARELLGFADGEERDGPGTGRRRTREEAEASSPEALRRRGSELLRLSGDLRYEEASHPAYMRILDSLSPDEGRILHFLARNGPQPSVDVRAGLPLASELVEPGCNMIGAEAGCRHVDRVHAYLDNLHRLGLIWFSREPVKDLSRYQVLEAQPEVTEARARGGRTSRTVRRSILLTPFGEDFCAVSLPA
ncbi:MAG TPA: Abi-alpha family protein [Solirubrobacterales bacterium]